MKTLGTTSFLMKCLAFLVLAMAGCEDFPDGLVNPPADPPSSVQLPANLIGTWIARSAVIDGQPANVDEVYEEGYHPKSDSFTIQFSPGGVYSYLFLDSHGTVLWHLQGPVQVNGEYMTLPIASCYGKPDATGFEIFKGKWSLKNSTLVLTTYYPELDDKPYSSVTYTKDGGR